MTLPPMINCGSRHVEVSSNQTLTYTPSISPIARARFTSLNVTFFGTFMLTAESEGNRPPCVPSKTARGDGEYRLGSETYFSA